MYLFQEDIFSLVFFFFRNIGNYFPLFPSQVQVLLLFTPPIRKKPSQYRGSYNTLVQEMDSYEFEDPKITIPNLCYD